MKGVYITTAKIVDEDNRRKLVEVQNGQLNIKNLKFLQVKKKSYLGGHWHTYPEVMYILKGKADYTMKNIDTGEEETFQLEEGDVVFRTGRIVHGGTFTKESIILDGATETYVSQDFNDIQYDLEKEEIKNYVN